MTRAIVLIIAHKERLTKYEEISLRQCFKVFRDYPVRLICPRDLPTDHYASVVRDIEIDAIHPKWQSTYRNFNLLKMHPFLYDRYRRFEYILFYELDAFVFRDELEYWCDKGYSYIGAPWFEGLSEAVSPRIVGVGNGGFSLRNTAHCRRGCREYSLIKPPREVIARYWRRGWRKRVTQLPRAVGHLMGVGNNIHYLFKDYQYQEDGYWTDVIGNRLAWYEVAGVEEASRFSFEAMPRYLFERNGRRLPFGCHAWPRYDLDFWRPYIEAEGYVL
jgi:hypothetical protein